MMEAGRRAFLPVLASSLLGACGFRPVYAPAVQGKSGDAALALAEISVGLIPERPGQLLRLALQERFERGGVAPAHQYDLTVSFGISSEALAIRQDSTATFVRLVGTATYSLLAQDPSRTTLASGTARSVDGYNLYDNQFFDADQESNTVQRRIAEACADQIALQLASFFAKRPASTVG